MELRTGDRVKVLSGKDAGKESRVAHVFPRKGKIIVEGVATAKRHSKPRGRRCRAASWTGYAHPMPQTS
jgi:large subunit ribosomal protein L24